MIGPVNPLKPFKNIKKCFPNFNWYIFGAALNVPLIFLDEIGITKNGDPEACTIEIVDYVNRTSVTPWVMICIALYKMSEYDLAMEVVAVHKLPVPHQCKKI